MNQASHQRVASLKTLLLQIGAEMKRVAQQSQQAADLKEAVTAQRRQMGSMDAATVEENQVQTRCGARGDSTAATISDD